MVDFADVISSMDDFIDEKGRDLKFRVGDKVKDLFVKHSPTIAYDYLNLTKIPEFSFLNEEFGKFSSEDFPGLSDYQIYFQKIQSICKANFEDLLNRSPHKEHRNLIQNPNKKLREVAEKLLGRTLTPENTPPFFEFGLYTNSDEGKAPRIFCFIGGLATIYVLFYDPFHRIYDGGKK